MSEKHPLSAWGRQDKRWRSLMEQRARGCHWDLRFWMPPSPRELSDYIGSRASIPRQVVPTFRCVDGVACDRRGRWWIQDGPLCQVIDFERAAAALQVTAAFLRMWSRLYVAARHPDGDQSSRPATPHAALPGAPREIKRALLIDPDAGDDPGWWHSDC